MLGPRRKKKVKPISTTRSYREIDEKKTSTFEEDDSMNIEEVSYLFNFCLKKFNLF